ncbi:hypothetical protein [Brevibacillus choshinensis]|uniref:Uncharacterized protein n=1 Tax=Brevibacillus choshinensis TaxID=54911 RepID=A0ABX7FL14_BRECH|nr:hypothetical protein [Brevibacillus choshinensis]QRG66006.1 hypothetical protein JNE38_20835 [Brevibacillus choshinensis]
MSIIHVNQIRKKLESDFQGKIDLTDVSTAKPEDQLNFFLTRALSAYTIKHFSQVDPDVASSAVVDGEMITELMLSIIMIKQKLYIWFNQNGCMTEKVNHQTEI